MTLANNPVERLELVALRMRNISDGVPLLQALVQVLGVRSTGEVMRASASLLDLPDQARQAVLDVDEDPFFLEWYSNLQGAVALTQNLDSFSRDFKGFLTEAVVASLRAAARRTSGTYGADDPSEEIAALKAQCDELRQSVLDASDLPPELKRFLVTQLDRLTLALGEFTIRGDAAVADVADAVVGAVVRATSIFPDSEWPDASKPIMQRILKMLNAFGAVATTSTAVLMLPSAVSSAVGYLP